MKHRQAVAYLMENPTEAPEAMGPLLTALKGHSDQAESIKSAIEEGRSAIEKLTGKFQQTIGAIDAVLDIAKGLLPVDKIDEWSENFRKANP